MSAEPLSEETMLEQALTFGSKEARMSYLQGACGSDESLRARVESLIEAHEAAGGFLKNRRSGLDGVVPTVLVPVTEKPGDRIGRYKLLQQIGEGGCGVVYMAEQEEPVHRRVAFKILKLGMETKSVIARFEAERQALALMDHPNIAKVLDAGATETGRPYFVMELVRGIKITEYCDQNNLSIRERLDLFIQVCHAIQHAHQKGIIHRDIKPSNILVTVNDGVPMPKVIDFGIAKATEQRLTDQTLFTAFEQFIGTPAYMSPEQAGMTSLDIDTRSDVYALGVLLYELLTGKTPFDPKTLLAAGLDEMRRTIREQEPVRPSTRLHTLPGEELTTSAQRRGTEAPKLIYSVRGDLDWIVMKCLEKDRTRRYETANGLAMDIERHLTHEPVVACPPSTAYRARKFIRRNQLMVTAAVLVAGVLVLGIVLSTWQTVRATRAEGKAEEALQHELAERQKALQAQAGEAAQRKVAEDRAEESRQRLVQVNVANGVRLMNEGQLFASLPWLVEALRLEEGRPEGEDLQRRRLGAVLEQCPQLTQIWFHDSPVKCVAFSPDGRRVATGTGRIVQFLIDKGTPGQAQVWDVETGEQVGQPLIHGSSISQLLFSPDGRWIATASADGTARVWDANSGEPVTPPLKHSNSVVCLTFSRDGSLLATASHDKTAQVWEARNGRSVTPSLPHLDVVWGVDFSPDATRLATVSSDGILRLWDTKSGACLFTRREHTSEILGGVQWSPDGSRWITASRDMTARLWDANKGEVLATLRHDEEVWRAAFSPDGWRVVTASVDGTARVWEVKTGAALTFRHGDWVHYAEFSPDGLMVATASRDRTARVWDAMTGRPLTPPLHHGGEVWQAVFSPDGHHLATVSYDGTARVWDLATGGSLVQFTHRLPVTRAALSPEQRRVLTASADGTTQLWDSDSGEPVGPPIVHLRGVSEALFSPDGRRLLTASYDRTARVWEAGAGNPLTPPMWHQEGVVHTAFSPDGRCVATASTLSPSTR